MATQCLFELCTPRAHGAPDSECDQQQHSHPPALIEVKFCIAKQTNVPVSPAKIDLNRCNESPLQGEKPDFWPVSKFNTGSLPLHGNPACKNKKN